MHAIRAGRLEGRRGAAARGQALVEFALVAPILLILMLGIFDVGRGVYVYNAIANAARNATRVAIVNQEVGRAEEFAVAEAALDSLDESDVTVTFSCTDKIGCLANVAIAYDYSPVTPMLEAIIGPITLTSESEMPIERVCSSDCDAPTP